MITAKEARERTGKEIPNAFWVEIQRCIGMDCYEAEIEDLYFENIVLLLKELGYKVDIEFTRDMGDNILSPDSMECEDCVYLISW